ncbi:MAG TPA: CocE/NonD family hydrolase, partial [Actinomycetota bacterium]|nr:CocE/NonD family hydrolase [Actinomycetota bacterium]
RPPGVLISSWDGTSLAADIYVPTTTATSTFPLILRGHGYPGQREIRTSGSAVDDLVKAGFMVLVWDERGFGQSGGEVHLLDPAYEGRDVIALIDYVKNTEPYASKLKLDNSGNPVVGMTGGSYGGGIQWSALVADQLLGPSPTNTAATNYIDALAPEITWNSLTQSLIPGGVPKIFITSLLLGTGETSSRVGGAPPPSDRFCPNTGGQDGLVETYLGGAVANGQTDQSDEFLGARSIATYLSTLQVPPTFLIQGLRDTLFPPNEAIATFRAIKTQQSNSKLMLMPTGHGWSGAPPVVRSDMIDWMSNALLGSAYVNASLNTSDFIYASQGRLASSNVTTTWGTDFLYAGFDAIDSIGATGKTLAAQVAPLLTLPVASSYADVTFFQGNIDNQADPGQAPNFDAPGTALTWDFPVGLSGADLAGTPHLTLNLTTTTPDLFLFGKFYDVDANGRASVIYHQVMPTRLRSAQGLGTTTVDWDLTALTAHIAAGHTLRLAVSTSDAAHSASRFPGATLISGGSLSLPVVGGSL